MNLNLKISIITPTFNSSDFISKNIKSVQNQSYQNFEHIIIDDCSNDNTYEICLEHAEKDSRIRVHKLKKNSGAGVARNKAIEMAKGRFIAFLDADDYWHPEKLKKQLNFMLENKIELSYSSYFVVNNNEKELYIREAPHKIHYKDILDNDYIGCLTAMYDTSRIGKQFMPLIRKRQDWVLWINILKIVKVARGLDEPLAYYRTGNDSISKNKFKLIKYNYNVYRKELKYSSLKSFFRMAKFLIYYFIYKLQSKKRI